ncbi:hypothetical protein CTA1_4899 [Colletotrichum tanaceti]|uniref:Uncharacterized protein n=1 Tax=Colletotrichum tanaceti TaxID=1306861 RepID=A0A4U6XVZ5_9PEZI|nr:hypothetical protein CTA1_4899 [Colletotrichum tanaceti]
MERLEYYRQLKRTANQISSLAQMADSQDIATAFVLSRAEVFDLKQTKESEVREMRPDSEG